MSDYLNQAPKELGGQSAKFKKLYPTLDDLPRGEYTIQPKFDGCHLIVSTSYGNMAPQAESRTGEKVRSAIHIVEQVQLVFGPGWTVFGEAYIFDQQFSVISGKFRQHAPCPELVFVMYDMVPTHIFKEGGIDIRPYSERLAALKAALAKFMAPALVATPEHPLDNLDPVGYARGLKKAGGYDGAILRRQDAGWQAGAAKQGEVLKVKPIQSLDLRVRGWFIGKGKHANRAGGIYVEYDGVQSAVGTGFSDAEREAIAQGLRAGWIAEVEFMDITEDGALREPRMKGWRHDKPKPD